ncbi:LysR substrate-binding domain-containing protein [Caballeronia sp. LZ029]|uniref:LysR family transcriptional regulator n=1 Tax=Caballeronia sp. LZ029 TaxID=3038564 RepID=UPI00285D3C68|nr:LysR substrate-binding domain-containing protein [Caballeronia sp. LZ029]MDR5744959.1 LysR substrate-binding domain-containing protein [Caballeronia sp. LZ029]
MGTFNRLHLIRQVDLFTLKLFLSAVEEQQIGLAAIRENIAASTATKRIQDLEDIAGVKLLERSPKGVVASPAGNVLARYIRTIFGSLEDMRAEIAAFTEGMQGELTVASARSVYVPFLSRELGEFSREYPLVHLVLRELENAEIIHAVSRGEADIGLFAAAHELDLGGVDVTPYRHDRMVVVVPQGHPLSAHSSVTFKELLPEQLITVDAMLGAFRAAARRLGTEFEPRHCVRSAGVAISLVQAGLGVTVQPECFLGHELLNRVSVIELAEPWAVRRIHIATPRGRSPSPTTRALMQQLLDQPRDESTRHDDAQ